MPADFLSQAGSSVVYEGVWMDYDRGSGPLGATLTLQTRKATALLSFLTVLVGISANRSWKIWRLLFHGLVTWRNPSRLPGAGQERIQVILRNTETAASTLGNLAWLPMSTTVLLDRRDCQNIVLLSVFALVHLTGFMAAGILTSQISLGRDVTSKSLETCGKWSPKNSLDPDSDFGETLIFRELVYNMTVDADNYVRNCYPQGVSRSLLDCGTFKQPYLPSYTRHNVDCPFDKNICLNGTSSAIELSSGNISVSDLGINTKFSHDISIQRKTTCAPISSRPFLVNISDFTTETWLSPDVQVVYYSFGATKKDNMTAAKGENLTIPYLFDNFTKGYSLDAFSFDTTWLDFAQPLHINRTGHTSLSIITLSAPEMWFGKPVDDPWFSAHHPTVDDANTTAERTRYYMDHFVNVLACDEQIKYCSTLTGYCSDWNAITVVQSEELTMRLGGSLFHPQSEDFYSILATTTFIGSSVLLDTISYGISNRGAAALQVSRYTQENWQTKIAPEQWKTELEYWFSTALARMQLEVFDTIEKPPGLNAEITENTWQTTNKVLLNLCGKVKFRSATHTSLSVVGLAVVVGVAGFLMIASFIDLPAQSFCKNQQFIQCWNATENLELVRNIEDLDGKINGGNNVNGGTLEFVSQTPDKASS